MHIPHCPSCDAEIVKAHPQVGDMTTCEECGAELEIISVQPLEVDFPLDYGEDDDQDEQE